MLFLLVLQHVFLHGAVHVEEEADDWAGEVAVCVEGVLLLRGEACCCGVLDLVVHGGSCQGQVRLGCVHLSGEGLLLAEEALHLVVAGSEGLLVLLLGVLEVPDLLRHGACLLEVLCAHKRLLALLQRRERGLCVRDPPPRVLEAPLHAGDGLCEGLEAGLALLDLAAQLCDPAPLLREDLNRGRDLGRRAGHHVA